MAMRVGNQGGDSVDAGTSWAWYSVDNTSTLLATGTLGPEAYSTEALADSETRRLEAMVEIETDQALTDQGRRGATLVVEAHGVTDRVSVTAVPGDPERPLGADRLREKFLFYAGPVVGQGSAAALADAVLTAPLDQALATVLAEPSRARR